MPNPVKTLFLDELTKRFGIPRKLPRSESMYEIEGGAARLYFRYSKKHPRNRTFFGLRKIDLQTLEGHAGILCFFWDGQQEPLFIPFAEFEEVFNRLTPANDGQYKVQVYETESGTELYIANAGRFNAESYRGWPYLESLVSTSEYPLPSLSHVQVQTLLGGIGSSKGFDVWIPPADRARLDWSLTANFRLSNILPSVLDPVTEIAEGIDVIWVDRGAKSPCRLIRSRALYAHLLWFASVQRRTSYASKCKPSIWHCLK